MAQRVLVTIWCECSNKIGEYLDRIEEKYPLWCEECDEYKRGGKYPWKLETRIIEQAGRWQDTTSGRVFIPEK